MSLTKCPIKTSKEYKDLLAKHNGNEQAAEEEWHGESGFGEREDLNTYPEADEDVVVTVAEKAATPIEQLVNDILLNLQTKLAVLQRKDVPNKTKTENEIKRLMEQIDAVRGVNSINLFVDDAYEKAKVAEKRFKSFVSSIGKQDRKAATDELIAFYDFANRYDLVDEISKQDVFEYFTSDQSIEAQAATGVTTPQQKLTYAISVKNSIKQQVSQYGIPLIADFLMNYRTSVEENINEEIENVKKDIARVTDNTTIKPESKAKELLRLNERLNKFQTFNVTRDSLIKLLGEVAQDVTAFDFLTGAMISSPDTVLALFAKAVKVELEGARMKNLQLEQEAAKIFEEYALTAGASRDNSPEFYKGIYETLRVPKRDVIGRVIKSEGKTVYEDRVSFVQKYDMSKFFKERYDKLPNRLELSENPSRYEREKYDKVQAERRAWFQKNTQPKSASDIQQILNGKQRELNARIITQSEYDAWIKTVIYTDESTGRTIYMSELTQPSDTYLNPKWLELYSEDGKPLNPKGKMHKWLTDTYLEKQEGLPDAQKLGYIIPSIEKTNGERLRDNPRRAITTSVKEKFQIQAYDTQYGVAGVGNTEEKFLPVYYTQSIDPSDVSLNLMRSVMMFGGMANNFKALSDIHSEIILTQKIVGERTVAEVNSKGQPLLNPLAQKLGLTKFIAKNGESYSSMRMNAFIDMIVYGEMEERETILGLQASKITNSLLGFSAITSIAADLIKGISNNLQGNIQLMIEAASGEFFSIKNLRKGKSYYMKSIPGFLSDFGKFTSDSLGGKLYDQFDPMQGEFADNFGRTVTASVANKLFRVDTLFFNQHFGEHEIQVSTMFAILDATMVIEESSGQEITLLEAYEKYGVEDIYTKTNFTNTKRIDIQNKLHALNKRLHGIYNSQDKSVAQKYSLGRLAFMYRKYLVPAYKRRFKNLGYDEELGAATEGYYKTFWNLYLKNLVTFQTSLIKNWGDLSPFEKAQVKRTIAEVTFILALTILAMALRAMVDDDDDELKKNWWYNLALYQALRMRSETTQYLPVVGYKDAYRTFKSPTAATGTIDRAIKFTDQFLLTWDSEKINYQRKTGIWDKGDNKSWAYFLRLMGLSGYTIKPEEAIKSFESSLAK